MVRRQLKSALGNTSRECGKEGESSALAGAGTGCVGLVDRPAGLAVGLEVAV